MVRITNNSINGIHDIMELMADTFDDLAKDPSAVRCNMGSRVLVIDSGKVFVKNSKREWIEL